MKRIMIFSFFLIFLTECSGFPKRITMEKNGMIGSVESINLIIDKSSNLDEIKPEVVERFKLCFNEQLAKKNIKLDANSNYSLRVIFKKYEDGNFLMRGFTGLIFGINFGKLAEIEATVILEDQKEVRKQVNVFVSSSRSGWNSSHGYGGAKGLENDFVKLVLKEIS